MNGADEATEALRKVLRANYRPVFAAGGEYAAAYAKATSSDDLVETMQHTIAVILAAEHLQEMAAETVKAARAVLAEQMDSTGATTIQTDGQTVYLSRKAAFVSVDQEDLVPPDYMRQPDPVIDKKAIKAAIEAGEGVPGCSLIRPNDFSLVIRTKKD